MKPKNLDKIINPNKKYKLSSKACEELFFNFNIPSVINDFLNKLKDFKISLYCKNKQDCIEKIIFLVKEKQIDFPYSKIVNKLLSNNSINKDNIFDVLKSKTIEEFEGDVISLAIDLKGSSKLSQNELKEIMTKIIYIINIFENLYKNEKLEVFSMNGDEINLGFFSNIISLNKKIEILSLLSIILELVTGKKFHYTILSWLKEKGHSINAIYSENIFNTIISESYSKDMKSFKKSGLPNYVEKDIIITLYPELKNIMKDKAYNVLPHKKFNLEEIYKLVSIFEENDIGLQHILSKSLMDYILNNLQNGYEKNVFKIEVAPKDIEVISYGEENNYLYMVIDGKSIININGNKHTTKVVEGKTIFGEASILGRKANATVTFKKGTKYIKLKKSFVEKILKGEIIINSKYQILLNNLLTKYVIWRDEENMTIQSYFQQLLGNYTKNIQDLNNSWILFLKILLGEKNKIEFKNIKNKTLIKEGEVNNKLYIIKGGSKLIFEKGNIKKTILLTEDMLVGENTFVGFLEGSDIKANTTIKIISGSYQEFEMGIVRSRLEKEKINIKEILEILTPLKELRGNSTNIVNFTGNNLEIIGNQKAA